MFWVTDEPYICCNTWLHCVFLWIHLFSYQLKYEMKCLNCIENMVKLANTVMPWLQTKYLVKINKIIAVNTLHYCTLALVFCQLHWYWHNLCNKTLFLPFSSTHEILFEWRQLLLIISPPFTIASTSNLSWKCLGHVIWKGTCPKITGT